jgi:hypothetical protein
MGQSKELVAKTKQKGSLWLTLPGDSSLGEERVHAMRAYLAELARGPFLEYGE